MGKKILFIENMPNAQKLLEKPLIQVGFEVISASDGEKGLELIKNEEPSLVLLELILPKKDGLEILKEKGAAADIKSIPVIILTDIESIPDAEKALKLGAASYLVKSGYKAEDVVEKIKEMLK